MRKRRQRFGEAIPHEIGERVQRYLRSGGSRSRSGAPTGGEGYRPERRYRSRGEERCFWPVGGPPGWFPCRSPQRSFTTQAEGA